MQMGRRSPGYRNVLALGLVSFFTDISTEMILGVLPAYLVIELGASKAALGLVEGSAELLNHVSRLLSGIASDRIGRRKPIVLAGYFLSSVAKPLFAFARTWVDALAVRVADRVGKGVRTAPRDALISQSVREREAGKAFGIHRTLDQLGAILGPLLAFALVPLIGIRPLFIASLIPAIASLAILALFVSDVATRPRERGALEGVGRVLGGSFSWVVLALALFNLGAYNFSFILVRASELGVAVGALPLVYAILNVAHTAAGYPSGVLADRVGRSRVLALGIALLAISSLLLAMSAGSLGVGLAIAIVYGLHRGVYETVHRAIVPEYVSEELRATAYGILHLVAGLSFFAGISVVGYLWDLYGRSVAFVYSALMAVVSAVVLLSPMCRTRRKR